MTKKEIKKSVHYFTNKIMYICKQDLYFSDYEDERTQAKLDTDLFIRILKELWSKR